MNYTKSQAKIDILNDTRTNKRKFVVKVSRQHATTKTGVVTGCKGSERASDSREDERVTAMYFGWVRFAQRTTLFYTE